MSSLGIVKGHPYLQRQVESEQTDLAKFPPVYNHHSLPIAFLHDYQPLIKPKKHKIHRTVSLGLHFLMKVPVSRKIYIK